MTDVCAMPSALAGAVGCEADGIESTSADSTVVRAAGRSIVVRNRTS